MSHGTGNEIENDTNFYIKAEQDIETSVAGKEPYVSCLITSRLILEQEDANPLMEDSFKLVHLN